MPLDATVLAALLASCAPNVAPETMLAIIQVESEADPYRIGVNSGSTLRGQPVRMVDAVATARSLLRQGANFDAGLMQINSANFARLGLTAETVFEPCTNLRAGARVLADNYGRARGAGHRNPLQAALSEYNTGSRSRGFHNGYVGKVFAAAGRSYSAAPTASPAVLRVQGGSLTPDEVGSILQAAFGGRITDTLRPMNATYGAEHSFHKVGQAVDFVPQGGMSAINRGQIRAVLAANGIEILELLGPGDRNHDNHWHVAFAKHRIGVMPDDQIAPAPWSVAVRRDHPAEASNVAPEGAFRVAASLVPVGGAGEALVEADPAPPAWDVFAQASWKQRQGSPSMEGDL